jgi:SAM-dependent methyltransferase
VLTPEEYLSLEPSYDPGSFLDSRGRAEVEAFLGVPEKVRHLAGILRWHSPPRSGGGRFLDVGCGMGGYLLAARSLGYEVFGLEPSASHSRVARDILGLPVANDYFTTSVLAGKTFDLIMLSHVIEHIYAPGRFLQQLMDTLTPGGMLVVITPNTRSLVASFLGPRWPMLRPVDHVTLINEKAYRHFGLKRVRTIRHFTSEYSFEFAASIASSIRQAHAETGCHVPADSPPVLRRLGAKTRLLRAALAAASLPAHLLAKATRRQACLTTLLIRDWA